MIDGYNKTVTAVSSSVKYSISAWTPTVYLRAVRGHEYQMKYTDFSGKTSDYTLERFKAENFQMSDLNMQEEYAVCGYVYTKEDQSYFVSLNRTAQLEGVKVTITITLNEKSDVVVVETDKDGFYFYNLGEEKLGASVVISATTPSKYYSYTESDASSSSNYKHMSKNTITTAGGLSTTLSNAKDQNFFLYFANCGLVRLD